MSIQIALIDVFIRISHRVNIRANIIYLAEVKANDSPCYTD